MPCHLFTAPQWHLRSNLLSFLYARVVDFNQWAGFTEFPRISSKLPNPKCRPGTALWQCLGTTLSPAARCLERVTCHSCPLNAEVASAYSLSSLGSSLSSLRQLLWMGRERSGNSLKPSGAPVVQPSGIYAGITFPAITILLLRALDNPTLRPEFIRESLPVWMGQLP